VEQDPLGRSDSPSRVRLRAAERQRETPQQRLGLLQPADFLEGHGGMDLRLHAAGEVAELLPELGEDVLEPALQRPLQVVGGQPRHQMCGRRAGGASTPPLSKTRSSTSTGARARMASAIASEGRESSVISPPLPLRYSVA